MNRSSLPGLAGLAGVLLIATAIAASAGSGRSVVIAQGKLDDLQKALQSREKEANKEEKQEQQRKKDEEAAANAEEARLQQEEIRLAPICDPLKQNAISILKNGAAGEAAFEQAQQQLQGIDGKLRTSCPERVTTFDGPVATFFRCYNDAFYVKLQDGRALIWTETTQTFAGQPKRRGERILGITDRYFACIQTTSPLVVLSGLRVRAVVRRSR